jgi:hypothetical protein
MRREGVDEVIRNEPSAYMTLCFNGKHSGFSSGFMGLMYRDNSLFGATRQKQMRPHSKKVADHKHIRDIENLEARARKRDIINIFKTNLGISIGTFKENCDLDRISEEQLFIKLRLKQFTKIEN